MNDFDEMFVLDFYNYFLQIKLNCDEENNANFKYKQYSKEDVV